jgi:hypothetical protein
MIVCSVSNFGKTSFREKMLVKKITWVSDSALNLDTEPIDRFAIRMGKTYHPFMFMV